MFVYCEITCGQSIESCHFFTYFFSQLIMEFTYFEFEVAHKIVPKCLTLFIRQEKRKKTQDTWYDTVILCFFLILVHLPINTENNYSQFGEGDGKIHPRYLLRFDHILTVLLALLVFGCVGAGELHDTPRSPASIIKLLLVLPAAGACVSSAGSQGAKGREEGGSLNIVLGQSALYPHRSGGWRMPWFQVHLYKGWHL